MATIKNLTKFPIAVPLPGGKKVHLAPNKSAEVSPKASSHPPVQKMVAAGKIEVLGGTQKARQHSGGKGPGGSGGGSGHGMGIRRTGDR
jgi:hypothetical protein